MVMALRKGYLWTALVVCAVATVAAFTQHPRRNRDLARRIRLDLQPLLADGAKILDAASGNSSETVEFLNAIERWQEYDSPQFISAVEATGEEDVIATIKYANEKGIPFLAKGGGHGAIKSLASFRNGIQIRVPGYVIVNTDNTARVGAGALTYDIVEELFAAGKQTVTGTCDCTGAGVALGGGHGFSQGVYGLIIDNIISARVVLGNGTAVTASVDENPDLFYALLGAGANFGIVTEFTYRIYDVPAGDSWYAETLTYAGDALESVYEQANLLMKTAPPELFSFSVYLRVPVIDPENAILLMAVMYNGPQQEAEPFVAPFRKLGPLQTMPRTLPHNRLSTVSVNTKDSPICKDRGLNRVKNGIYLEEFNITSQRRVFDLFNDKTSKITAFNTSTVLFEGLPIQRTSQIPEDSTSKPFRDLGVLVATVITYAVDKSLDQEAENFVREIRQILHEGTNSKELRTYLNYAIGDESLSSLYGSKDKVARLQDIKRTYDPENRFRFYAPITV